MAGEFAIVAVERSKVERRAAAGDRRAQRILVSLQDLSFQLSGAQLGITVTSLIIGVIAEPAVARLIDPLVSQVAFVPDDWSLGVSLALAIALATATQMVFGELVPKNLAIARPYRTAVWFGIPMQFLNRLIRPVIQLLNAAANWTVRKFGIEPRPELAGVRSMEELELMIRSSGEDGELDDSELALLTRALTFTEKVAADALIPRVSVIGMNRHEPVSELRRLARETGHSRFPVFGEDLDEIVGIAHLKDTFGVKVERRSITPVSEIVTAVLQVPDSRPLDQVLSDLQEQGRSVAVVVDEYGGTAGIITVEDLLEEIFGEIEDEHDPDDDPASPDQMDLLPGLLHRHELEEVLGYEWPEGRYETLGGFLVAQIGRFPRRGEVIEVDGWAFEIVAMDGHRIDRVRAVSRPTDPEEPTS